MIIEDLVDRARQYSAAEPVLVPPSADTIANRLREELAPPFLPEVEAAIRAVDWETAAIEWCP